MFQVEISFSNKHHSEAEKTPCFQPSNAGQVDGMCQERAQKAAKVESFLADIQSLSPVEGNLCKYYILEP